MTTTGDYRDLLDLAGRPPPPASPRRRFEAVHEVIRPLLRQLAVEGAAPDPNAGAAVAGRLRFCHRCDRLSHESRTIDELPRAESWVGPNGLVYWLTTCVHCTDFEVSMRWEAKYRVAKSKNDVAAIRALEERRAAWLKAGRRFVGTTP